jgi:hypothetical protein
VLRLRAGSASLQHLERTVLGVTRLDDLPGAECPAAWYAYLRGDTRPMEAVLEHNLLDLLSLPPLAAALADAAAGAAPAEDLHAAGLAFARARIEDRALPLQLSAAGAARDASLAGRAHAEASRLYRRRGDRGLAAAQAAAATEADPSLSGPWLALSKHAEHADRDYERALSCALVVQRTLFLTSRSKTAHAAVAKRIDRLRRKIADARS